MGGTSGLVVWLVARGKLAAAVGACPSSIAAESSLAVEDQSSTEVGALMTCCSAPRHHTQAGRPQRTTRRTSAACSACWERWKTPLAASPNLRALHTGTCSNKADVTRQGCCHHALSATTMQPSLPQTATRRGRHVLPRRLLALHYCSTTASQPGKFQREHDINTDHYTNMPTPTAVLRTWNMVSLGGMPLVTTARQPRAAPPWAPAAVAVASSSSGAMGPRCTATWSTTPSPLMSACSWPGRRCSLHSVRPGGRAGGRQAVVCRRRQGDSTPQVRSRGIHVAVGSPTT